MIKQISKFHLLQIINQEIQAHKVHKEQLMQLEAEFYTFLLEKVDVREAISKLEVDARVSAARNGGSYKPPSSTWLLVEMNKEIGHNSVSDFLRHRAEHKRMILIVFLLSLAGLLLRNILGWPP